MCSVCLITCRPVRVGTRKEVPCPRRSSTTTWRWDILPSHRSFTTERNLNISIRGTSAVTSSPLRLPSRATPTPYGGRLTYLVASQQPLTAAVSYYSGGVQRKNFHGNDAIPALTDRTAVLQTPWLGFIGEQDFMLEPGELDEWETALKSAPVDVELVRYAGSGHAFDVDMPFGPGMPSPYVAEVADDAERRTLEFLTARLG